MAVELIRSKRAKKRMIAHTVTLLASQAGFNLPEIELVELPELRVSRFDEEAQEWEIAIKVRSKVRPLAEA
jgi:hypothetical protein